MSLRFVPSLLLVITLGYSISAPAESKLSINELMVQVITPATNTLWGADDPQTEAEWKILAEAAGKTHAAAIKTGQGGVLSDGNNPSGEPEWENLADQMVKAAVLAQKAIRAKDFDALLDAGNELYTPCEACHQIYHPGVKGNL